MDSEATNSLRQHLNTLEDALCALQNLSLLADAEESTRLETTCQRIVAHMNVLRAALA